MPIGEGTYTDGKPPKQVSLDGQGETELVIVHNPVACAISNDRLDSQTKTEHRYVYYRLYTKDGALESNNPIFSNDLFISRISSKSVRPRRTAGSLKRCLCKFEGFEGPKNAALYLSLSEKTPLDDSTHVSLRGNSGSGLSESNPVVLVVDTDTAKKRLKAASKIETNELPVWQVERRYIYYRLYDEDTEVVSKTSFDENDSSLGRINTFSIPPPHTVASLKHCLAIVEGVTAHDAQLFEDEDGEITMNDGDAIALTDSFPGFMQGRPIVFTYALRLSDQIMESEPSFSKRLTVTRDWPGATRGPKWHSVVAGEILKTDGIQRTETYSTRGSISFVSKIFIFI